MNGTDVDICVTVSLLSSVQLNLWTVMDVNMCLWFGL